MLKHTPVGLVTVPDEGELHVRFEVPPVEPVPPVFPVPPVVPSVVFVVELPAGTASFFLYKQLCKVYISINEKQAFVSTLIGGMFR